MSTKRFEDEAAGGGGEGGEGGKKRKDNSRWGRWGGGGWGEEEEGFDQGTNKTQNYKNENKIKTLKYFLKTPSGKKNYLKKIKKKIKRCASFTLSRACI